MRELGLKDAFSVARIIKSADLKNEIVEFAKNVKTKDKKNAQEVGLEFIVTMISSLSSKEVENEFYSLYADIRGDITPEQASLMDITEVIADIKHIIAENDIQSFFTSLSALT